MAKPKSTSIGDQTIGDITRLLEHHRAAASVLENTLRLMTGVQTTLFAPPTSNGHSAEAPTTKQRRAPKPTYGEAKTTKREATLRFLAGFDRTDAKSIADVVASTGDNSAVGPLVTHGYLKAKGDGYVRTAKEFTV